MESGRDPDLACGISRSPVIVTVAARLAECEKLKALAAEKFKEKKYKEAQSLYEHARNVIIDGTTTAGGEAPSDVAKLDCCYVLLSSNIAQCCINLEDFNNAIYNADVALKQDPQNVKALYRRGFSNLKLNEGDVALKDLKLAFDLEPLNKEVESLLSKTVTMCLFDSARIGDLHKIISLLQDGADINARSKNSNNVNPLMVASHYGHINVVKLLLSKGANIHEKSNDGNSALLIANSRGQIDIIELLLSNGANIHDKNDMGHSSILKSVGNGNTEIVKWLLSKGANVHDKSTGDGISAIILAAKYNMIDMAEILLSRGANIHDKLSDDGWSSIIAACVAGHSDMVGLLLSKGASAHDRSISGSTCFMLASNDKTRSILKYWSTTLAIIMFEELQIYSILDDILIDLYQYQSSKYI